MLILPRFDGERDDVSLSPRKDGPLIEGGSVDTGTGAFRGVSEGARVGAGSGRVDGVDPTPTV